MIKSVFGVKLYFPDGTVDYAESTYDAYPTDEQIENELIQYSAVMASVEKRYIQA